MSLLAKLSVPKQFLGAFKCGHRKASQEFIDEDLAFQLLAKAKEGCEESLKALEWLTRFNNEYHKDVFVKDDNSALHREQIVEGELDRKGRPLTFKKECQRRNYLRRNDLYTSATIVHADVVLFEYYGGFCRRRQNIDHDWNGSGPVEDEE